MSPAGSTTAAVQRRRRPLARLRSALACFTPISPGAALAIDAPGAAVELSAD